MATHPYGEKIGTIHNDAVPQNDSEAAYGRFEAARWTLANVIWAYLLGAGRRPMFDPPFDPPREPLLESESGVYAHPPVGDPEQARRMGQEIAVLLDIAYASYPGEPLDPSEIHTFIPAEPHSLPS